MGIFDGGGGGATFEYDKAAAAGLKATFCWLFCCWNWCGDGETSCGGLGSNTVSNPGKFEIDDGGGTLLNCCGLNVGTASAW